MPASITKSAVPEEMISRMVSNAFGEDALEIEELKEGYFNVAYRIGLKDRNVVLKIAPPGNVDTMTSEKNIMFSEVDSIKMAAEKTEVPVPEILFYDSGRTILDREYFFMEMLEGQSLSSLEGKLSEREKQSVYFDAGKYTRMLNEITGKGFGYYSRPDKQGESWYQVFRSILMDVYYDAGRKAVLIPVERERLLLLLERDEKIFEAVKIPRFVHWDIWDGNIFVKDGKIEGIIDFERCLWGDVLMEVGFRTYGYRKAFFDGYGMKGLSPEEERRAKWYDIYLFLTWCIEGEYRKYEDDGLYRHGCEMLKKWVKELEGAAG